MMTTKMPARLAAAICALVAGSCGYGAAAEQPVNVAVLHGTFDNFRHPDEHDAALKQVGWQSAKYPSNELKRLVADLGQYDLVLGNPLFNYGDVQDYGACADKWRAFMERGGGGLAVRRRERSGGGSASRQWTRVRDRRLAPPHNPPPSHTPCAIMMR